MAVSLAKVRVRIPGMTPSQPTILAVFAHPDDEAFSVGGTLAHYAQKGVKVVLACATRGEAGKITDPSMTITDLGQHREAELKRATAALGIPGPGVSGLPRFGKIRAHPLRRRWR